jgi:hypothetical protein
MPCLFLLPQSLECQLLKPNQALYPLPHRI